ncbi:hypothetical protein [Hanstruepera marina]|uniref:hypothetical protein n=1 Tax=Hanstruepera marina TaxID=2873265 RepID=UPI001CA615CC|nr:hypothetical protein [Hanstruepera marina]
MRIALIFLLAVCIGCSSSDEDNIIDSDPSTLAVNVTQDKETVEVDEIVTLTARANETIKEISFSKDGGVTFPSSYSTNFGSTANLYFSFDELGEKTIIFRVKNNDGDFVDRTVNITVEQGNAVRLQSVQLSSFYDMGNTWDDEYPASNPNHLADVFFAILKPPLNVYQGTRGSVPTSSWLWYRSDTRDNENNLNWDIQDENLFINVEELSTYIAFADEDNNGVVQDLMLGPPFESEIPLVDYMNSQPNSITIQESNIELEYTVGVEW